MRRTISALTALLVVVATVAVAPAAGFQVNSEASESALAQQTTATDGNETADGSDVAPGARLAGVVGVQRAEVDGEVESRSFGLSVARAANDNARAALVAAEVDETGAEVENLSAQREQLREARENGSLSEGEYRARVAELAARSANAGRMANQSANAARGLPEDVLRANGVNVTAIQTLQERASGLGGPAVAEIARSIAGDPGRGLDDRPEQARDRGERSDQAGNVTDRGQADGPPTDGDADATTGAGDSRDTNRTNRSDSAGGDRGR